MHRDYHTSRTKAKHTPCYLGSAPLFSKDTLFLSPLSLLFQQTNGGGENNSRPVARPDLHKLDHNLALTTHLTVSFFKILRRTSLLGFKARVGSLICTWWRCMWYMFLEIHLWCHTCQLLVASMAAKPFSSMYL